MPPRLRLSSTALPLRTRTGITTRTSHPSSTTTTSNSISIPAFLVPCLHRPAGPNRASSTSTLSQRPLRRPTSPPTEPFTTDSSPSTIRSISILSALRPAPGSKHRPKRVGRGPSSGKGKTSGRGTKGQLARGKGPRPGFEGGQTPASVVAGKRGFKNLFAADMTLVNLDTLQQWIDAGRINPALPVTVREMHASRLTHGIKDGVKLLARERDTKFSARGLTIVVSQASAGAIAAIEREGGRVVCRYYTRQAVRRVIRGEMHPTESLLSRDMPVPMPLAVTVGAAAARADGQEEAGTASGLPAAEVPNAMSTGVSGLGARRYRYRLPDPTSRQDFEYYRDPAHRGYLSHTLKLGESPSLYFKTPAQQQEARDRAAQRARDGVDPEAALRKRIKEERLF